jgi:hypothetical protein
MKKMEFRLTLLAKENAVSLAKSLYLEITNLPKGIRTDDKARTGIQVLIREPSTENFLFESVENPSARAKFFVTEKSVRCEMLGIFSSLDNAIDAKLWFGGCIVVVLDNGTHVHFSTSGLETYEDIAVSVRIAAATLEMTTAEVLRRIVSRGSKIPNCFHDENDYLHKILFPPQVEN